MVDKLCTIIPFADGGNYPNPSIGSEFKSPKHIPFYLKKNF